MMMAHDDLGHRESAGYAIGLMGAIAAILLVLVQSFSIDLGFIDSDGIAGIGLTFLTVGTAMVWSSRRREG